MPTASPAASSRSTARSTRLPPTTARTACTAARQGFDKRVWTVEPLAGVPEVAAAKLDLYEQGRRGRLSRQPHGRGHLHAEPTRTSSGSNTWRQPTSRPWSTLPATPTSTSPATARARIERRDPHDQRRSATRRSMPAASRPGISPRWRARRSTSVQAMPIGARIRSATSRWSTGAAMTTTGC